MFTSPSKFLFGAVVAATALLDFAQAGQCDNGPWTNVQAIGETHPDPNKMVQFCATQFDVGIVITGLEVWWDPNQGINAIAVKYSNGDKSAPYGVPGSSPNYQNFEWNYADGTFVESLSLWGNGGGGQLGNIRLSLTNGQQMDVGNRNDGHSKKTEWVIDVASGVMLGVGGWGADNIKQGFFLFLKSKIDKIALTNPVFDDSVDNLNAQQKGIQTVTLDSAEHSNNAAPGTANETFTFTKAVQETNSKTISSEITNTFGLKISTEISGEILDLGAKDTFEVSYGYSDARGQASTTTEQVTLTWAIAGQVAPGSHIYCRATAKQGKSDLGYTAQVDVWLKDGSSWSFSEHGTYSQVIWTQAQSSCQDKQFAPTKRAVQFIS